MFKRKRKLRPVVRLVIVCLIFVMLIIAIDLSLRDTFYGIAEVKAVQLATNTIQETVKKQVADRNIQYQDFVTVHTDSEGRITLIQADTVKVNRFSSTAALAIENSLESYRWQSFSIPLGQALRLPILANWGPEIVYHIMPVGTVMVNVIDKFESAGINQTRHAIYLSFDTSIRIIVPTKSCEKNVSTQVLLAESIIVGSVPGTYVNVPGGIFGGGLLK